MGLFDNLNWDLPYGSLMQKNQTTTESTTNTAKRILNNANADAFDMTKDNKKNAALNAETNTGTGAVNLNGSKLDVTVGKQKLSGTNFSNHTDQSTAENQSTNASLTQGLDAVTTNKAGFHQDKMTPERQEAMKQSALNQAMGGVLKSLTGIEGGVSDAAGAYMQQRQGIVDKYNEQISKDNIAGFSSSTSASGGSSLSKDVKNIKTNSSGTNFDNSTPQDSGRYKSDYDFGANEDDKKAAAALASEYKLPIGYAAGTNVLSLQVDLKNPTDVASIEKLAANWDSIQGKLPDKTRNLYAGLIRSVKNKESI